MHKVAVLDDDQAWCRLIEEYFRDDFDVMAFTTPTDFIEQAHHYDLALIDYYLPPINGYGVICNLRRHQRHCPILVLVSGTVDMEKDRFFPEADSFLVKDIGPERILKRVKEMLLAAERANAELS